MEKLSKMQQKVYDYIVRCVEAQGYPPSVREICAALNFKSPSTAHFHIKHLEQLGYLERNAGKGRAITLNREALPARAPSAPSAWQEEAEGKRDRVPIVGNVAAGSPILAQECVEDYLTFDPEGPEDEYFALRVRGESMVDAGILNGDLVVVRSQPSASSGEIVVAMIDGEATVKRLSRRNGRVWLMPENPEYSPIDGTFAQILGKVTAVVRRY